MKPGMQIGIANAPESFPEMLGELPAGAAVIESPGPGTLDMLLLFVKSVAELQALAPAHLPAIKYDDQLWIAYPKKTA